MEDYRNVGEGAGKIVTFHDIYAHEYDGLNGGVSRTWREVSGLCRGNKQEVFSKYPDEWMGIGCILK